MYFEEDFGLAELVVSVAHDSSADVVRGLTTVDHVRRTDAADEESKNNTK